MKKPVLFLLSGLLLLASCQGEPETVSSSPIDEDSTSVDAASSFEALLDELSTTSSYRADLAFYVLSESGEEKRTSYGIQSQFGPDALLWEDETGAYAPMGALKNGDQGVFEFTLDGENVALGDFVTLDGGLDIGEIYDSPLDFAPARSWKQDEDNLFRNNSSLMRETMASLCGLADLASHAGIQFSYGSLYATLEGEGIRFSMEGLLGEQSVVRAELGLTDIGTASSAAVASYLENPTLLENPTSWSKEQSDIIRAYFGGESAIDLPFPTGASYALTVEGLEAYGEALIYDVASGDLTSSYQTLLIEAGFAIEPRADLGGSVAFKDVKDGNITRHYSVLFLYFSQADIKAMYGEETALLYPEGRFQIEILYSEETSYSLEEANAYLNEASNGLFPAPSYSGIQNVTIDDYSSVYPSVYSCAVVFFYELDGMQNAINAISAYGATLVESGFSLSDKSTDYEIVYENLELGASVTLALDFDQNGDYAGTFEAFYLVKAA